MGIRIVVELLGPRWKWGQEEVRLHEDVEHAVEAHYTPPPPRPWVVEMWNMNLAAVAVYHVTTFRPKCMQRLVVWAPQVAVVIFVAMALRWAWRFG